MGVIDWDKTDADIRYRKSLNDGLDKIADSTERHADKLTGTVVSLRLTVDELRALNIFRKQYHN